MAVQGLGRPFGLRPRAGRPETALRSRESVLVGGGGLGPQVKLGPVGLDLAPDRERAESEHGQHD